MDSLQAITLANRGYFTRAQALDCGETDQSLLAALRGGELARLRRGVYAPAAGLGGLDDWARHVLLARAVVATQRGQVALTGPSAAALHGFTLYGHDLQVVHLLRLDAGSSRTEAGVNHHVAREDLTPEIEEKEGLLVLSRARTVWEVARMSTLEGGVCTADSALHADPQLKDVLRDLIGRYFAHPGGRQAKTALSLARSGADSAGESVTRVQCYRYSLPEPELQFEVHDDAGLVGLSDFSWEEYRHLGEFDGKVKYQKFLRNEESPSDCVFREKRREDRMRGTERGMTRFVWSEIMPDRARTTMLRLQQDLDRSRRLYTRDRTVIL